MRFAAGIWFAVFLLLLVFWQQARAQHYTWQKCKDLNSRYYSSKKVAGQNPDKPDLDATTLSAEYCGLDKLEHGSFDNMPNLRKILLHKNKLKTLPETVFKNVQKVTHLSVADNKLEHMPRFGHYSLFPELIFLTFQYNKIRSLCHPDTFSSTTKLEQLNLGNNEIGYIHPDIFKPLVNLKMIYLGNNQVAYVSDKMFQIKTLEEVYLNHNVIQYIAPDAFLGTKLKTLNLEWNRLTYLPEHFLIQLKNSGANVLSFPVHDNPWQCRCLLEIMGDIFKLGIRDYAGYDFFGSSPSCVTDNNVRCVRPSKETADVTLYLLENYLSKTKSAKSCIN